MVLDLIEEIKLKW